MLCFRSISPRFSSDDCATGIYLYQRAVRSRDFSSFVLNSFLGAILERPSFQGLARVFPNLSLSCQQNLPVCCSNEIACFVFPITCATWQQLSLRVVIYCFATIALVVALVAMMHTCSRLYVLFEAFTAGALGLFFLYGFGSGVGTQETEVLASRQCFYLSRTNVVWNSEMMLKLSSTVSPKQCCILRAFRWYTLILVEGTSVPQTVVPSRLSVGPAMRSNGEKRWWSTSIRAPLVPSRPLGLGIQQ